MNHSLGEMGIITFLVAPLALLVAHVGRRHSDPKCVEEFRRPGPVWPTPKLRAVPPRAPEEQTVAGATMLRPPPPRPFSPRPPVHAEYAAVDSSGASHNLVIDSYYLTNTATRPHDHARLVVVDDRDLRWLCINSAEPTLIFFTDGGIDCARAEMVLERSYGEQQERRQMGAIERLQMFKAPLHSTTRLFSWTRSKGQPLGRAPACVLYIRGSPVATIFGSFTPEALAQFIFNHMGRLGE